VAHTQLRASTFVVVLVKTQAGGYNKSAIELRRLCKTAGQAGFLMTQAFADWGRFPDLNPVCDNASIAKCGVASTTQGRYA